MEWNGRRSIDLGSNKFGFLRESGSGKSRRVTQESGILFFVYYEGPFSALYLCLLNLRIALPVPEPNSAAKF